MNDHTYFLFKSYFQMKIQFNIHYDTLPGQDIYVCGSVPEIGGWHTHKASILTYLPGGNWSAEVQMDDSQNVIEYKYLIKDQNGNVSWEWGNNRKIYPSDYQSSIIIAQDSWRAPSNEEKVMFTAAFSKVIMKPNGISKPGKIKKSRILQFKIQLPRISRNYKACVLGNQKSLGNWNTKSPLLLECVDEFPTWSGNLDLDELTLPVRYKYGIFNIEKKEVVTIEEGFDREINTFPNEKEYVFIKADESFRYPLGNWKGAGVSVPVFSLRTENGFGVGDFSDLLDFIDWAKKAGMKMVQILPVNETIASHNWLDSYPYKSISVMALHPIYMNLEKLGTIESEKLREEFAIKKDALNAETHVDYPEVLRYKSKYFKLVFDQKKETFLQSDDFKKFFADNEEWLVPYAAFVYLRDKMKSPDFRQWGSFSKYNKDVIAQLSRPDSDSWDDIAVHYFIQFHLDKQLREVTQHAREKGIVLKGDIPIGISPNSVEAWTEPHLFNLDAQAGAPPDDFAVKGQNWGFPTYNWEQMAMENYNWWKKRLQKMANYFDAYRIDHILGFFRIWEIPIHAVEGILGYFNPALPLSSEEIQQFGVEFDYERMVKPYIRHHLLENIFGEFTNEVITKFLEGNGWGSYKMRDAFNTQQKINRHFLKNTEEEELSDKERLIRDGLFGLIVNILFIQTGHNQWHPRISFQSTSSYNELDDHTKHQLGELYNHFFYKRHDEFWYYTGMDKLPAIIHASNMLVCGEDLGMVPDCVPPVMDQLNILSLEIQRMSKNPKIKFAHPSDAPYLSVCTTSTHDMPTIRGWWEGDKGLIQLFYNHELGNAGQAPFFAEPWICKQIIVQHLYSPAMWTTFPIQDLIAMDENLRWHKTKEEQINEPSNVRHKWRYRMHQSIEDLNNANDFNDLLKTLIDHSGRNSDY